MSKMKRMNKTIQKLDCCPVAGNEHEFGRRKTFCLNCCGSHICIALAFIFIPIPFVGMNIMIGVIEGQERLMYHPSTDSETIWGEIINLVGNPVDRAELFKDMYDNGEAHDNIFLTGDSHMFWASNVNINDRGHYVLPEQAKELISNGRNVFTDSYKLKEKEAKIGVEVMPSSTSSQGIYDYLLESGLADWQAAWASEVVVGVFKHYNPHFTDIEMTSHGIGFVHITQNEATFEYFRACVFRAFRQSVLYWTARVIRGANEWDEDDLKRYPEDWETEAGYKWYW
uniref:PhoD-like phosphatase metallophosphatase domain-containing protein n=1 Tax=Aplanochytrium stocchinoi TaxID=215587 RepID=A0A6S8FV53_9STRA|mmetsp:Transcript_5380/g.6800  ORF Transcript_5380/g.6800 Transcript_5380/m.6800 type:complete len:284 (-) Transcript_5380:1228-2079(-)